MHTHTSSLVRLALLSYLILCLATSAPATADTAVRTAVFVSSAALYLLAAAANTLCTPARANVSFDISISGKDSLPHQFPDTYTAHTYGGSPPYTYQWTVVRGSASLQNDTSATVTVNPNFTICDLVIRCTVKDGSTLTASRDKSITVTRVLRRPPHSKPAIWINFADPRPKGDDADNGAQPSYYPQVSINNVSLTPGVFHRVLNAPVPGGFFDLSLNLAFSPPSLSFSYPCSYTLSASPSPFGHCWSDNLTPCGEHSICSDLLNSQNSFSFSGGTLPSASFDDGLPQPLTRASLATNNTYIIFWGSGRAVDFSDAVTHEVGEWPPDLDRSSICYWPRRIVDRNTNALLFSYGTPRNAQSGPGNAVSGLCIPTIISNNRSRAAVKYETGPNGFVARALYLGGEGIIRTASFSYTTLISHCAGLPLTNILLSSVVLPDNSQVSYHYAQHSLNRNGTSITFPCLSSFTSPAGTNRIEYDSWDWNGNYFAVQKYEPSRIRLVLNDGLTTQTYERINHSYNMQTLRGTASMRTITDTATTNVKHYTISLDLPALQWYGCESHNTLDTLNQHAYSLDARFRYTSVSRFPYGGATPSDTTSFSYDDHDNLTSVTDPYGNVTRYFYAPNKLDQTCVIDPRGVVTTNIFDSRGNLLISIEDFGSGKLNRTSSNVYNTAGQVIKSFDPLGRVTRNFYSTSPIPAPPSFYAANEPSHLSNGYLVATRDPLGRVSTFTYDALGRKIIENTPGDPAYNNGRYTITNTYDIMDRLTSTMYPDNTYISNIYNAAGYPVRARDRMGREITNTWDAAGHLLRVDYPNGDWVKKEYSGNLVTRVIDARHNTTDYFYCHEQLTGVRFPDGSTRAAGFDNSNRCWPNELG